MRYTVATIRCDRCSSYQEQPAGPPALPPGGWTEVSMTDQKGRIQRVDLCASCTADIRAALAHNPAGPPLTEGHRES